MLVIVFKICHMSHLKLIKMLAFWTYSVLKFYPKWKFIYLKPSETWNKKCNLWLISSHTHAASPWSSYYFSCSVVRLAVHEGPNRIAQFSWGVKMSPGKRKNMQYSQSPKLKLPANHYLLLNWQQSINAQGNKPQERKLMNCHDSLRSFQRLMSEIPASGSFMKV